MKFSVCIAATRPTTLQAAVDSIRRQTWTDWELIIVGQGNDSGLRRLGEALAQSDQRVRYIHLERRGLSLARNAAVQASTADLIAMLDDDCEADQHWLEVLAGCFAAEPEVGVVSGSLLAPRRSRRGLAICPAFNPAEALYDPIASGRRPPSRWDWVGGNFALRRSVAERIGPFDEYLGAGAAFPAAEDTDYKLRLEALSIKMRSTPRAIVYHTYGFRYGLRAVLNNSKNYARGNAGLAGKLTLLGDPRGREWLEMTKQSAKWDWLCQRKPQRLPANLLRLWYYTRAYRSCLRDYRADAGQGLLYPAAGSAPVDKVAVG